jgi:hypothetical protein
MTNTRACPDCGGPKSWGARRCLSCTRPYMKGRYGSEHPTWKDSRYDMSNGYVAVANAGHPFPRANSMILEHVKVVEERLGRRLRPGECVHHFNGDRRDNRPRNLVLCPDAAYHRLLHRRQQALADCGDPDKRRCSYCGEYDVPAALVFVGPAQYHRTCKNAWQNEYRRGRPRRSLSTPTCCDCGASVPWNRRGRPRKRCPTCQRSTRRRNRS